MQTWALICLNIGSVQERVAPPAMGVRGYHPKNMENIRSKSCVLVHRYISPIGLKEAINFVLKAINFVVEIFDQSYIYRYTKRDNVKEQILTTNMCVDLNS